MLRTVLNVLNKTEKELQIWSMHYVKILSIHNSLWDLLSKSINSSIARNRIFDCLISLEQIISITSATLSPTTDQSRFCNPTKYILPSIRQQVATEPKEILDPYEASLRCNYYFPLSDMSSLETSDDPPTPSKPTATSPKLSTKTSITCEDSIEAISDILAEMEEDELPVKLNLKLKHFNQRLQSNQHTSIIDLPSTGNAQPPIWQMLLPKLNYSFPSVNALNLLIPNYKSFQ